MLLKKQYQTNRDRYGKDEEATSLLISGGHDFIPRLQDDNAGGLLSMGSSSHTPQLSRINGIQNPVENNVPKRPQRTALPRFQMLVLCVLRLSEPIAYTQIFPYINQMVENMKLTDNRQKIGYYSGLIDSMFAISQLFTILYWGRLSDRIGRKPVILIGLSGVALSAFLFGLSRTFWWTVLSRSLAGALSGNAAVTNSVVSEITDETNQMDAFPLMALAWSLGCVIGPLIGGNLSNPEENFSRTFGAIQMFKDYPYFLPCLISSLITVATVVIGILFLEESLPSKAKRMYSKSSKVDSDRFSNKISMMNIISSKNLRYIFLNYFLLSVCGISFDVIFILLAYTPVQFGGLSRSPSEIGLALAFSGIAGALLQVFVFPRLYRRFQTVPLYSLLTMMWPIAFLLLPYLSNIARSSIPAETFASASFPNLGEGGKAEELVKYPAGVALWVGIGITLMILRCGHMCYSLNTILIRNATPSQEALGATFGLAQTVACVARAGSPALVSSLFAVSIQLKVMGGNLVWVVTFLIASCTWCSAFFVSDDIKARFDCAEEYTLLSMHAGDPSSDSLEESA